MIPREIFLTKHRSHWTCPCCETRSQGAVCIVCGTPRPQPEPAPGPSEPAPDGPDLPALSERWWLLAVAIGGLVFLMALAVCLLL